MRKLISMHCHVSGHVHGVCFRGSTQKQAAELGITGWVQNLADGRVEVMAYGEKEQLMALYTWLKKGPPLARVMEVSYEELPWQPYGEFEILYKSSKK